MSRFWHVAREAAVPTSGRDFGASLLQWRIPRRDIGILPLILCCPIMYYPKVVDGDTQPWVLIAGLIALFTFRTEHFVNKRDWPLVILSVLCVGAYAARAEVGFGLLRAAYTYVAFLVLWTVCQRDTGKYLTVAVKATVIVWFAVGILQYVLVHQGIDIGMGRYQPGRSGVPSLTAEASFYGSISMLQLMYLLSLRKPGNRIYIAAASASVVLSGSVLAMLLLIFPLWKLPLKYRFLAAIVLAALVAGDYYLSSAGLGARLVSIGAGGADFGSAALDASLNLRLGNIYFTLVRNLIPSLLMQGPVSFMSQYNSFAHDSGVFIGVESDNILPALGEMIYGSGIIGVALLMVFLKRALEHCRTRRSKFERLVFIFVCMLNPISLSNIFLIMYAQVED